MSSAPAFFLVTAALLLAACGQPQQVEPTAQTIVQELSVTDAWARPSPGGVDMAAGYLTVSSAADDALVGASSPRAGAVELHIVTTEDGISRMRPAESLPVPAQGTLSLAPTGAHLMFMQLDSPFAEGEQVPVTLRFSSGAVVETVLSVRQNGVEEEAHDHH